MADGRYLLLRYHNLVSRHAKPLKCQFCFKKFSAQELESHFFSEHRYRFPSQNSCPWCAGERSWKPRQKHRHARHLSECFKRYQNRHEWINSGTCEPREFYGRTMLFDAHIYAYESVFLPPLQRRIDWWDVKEEEGQQKKQQLFVESEDLGIGYVRKFIHFEGSPVGWFHLAVRAYALAEFFDRFEDYRDRAFLLEFSCWCDGGEPHEDSFHRHHRHMIAVARNGKDFYENCWKKVEVKNAPDCYKMCRVIGSWIHLKNTIFCLSSRKASCGFFDSDFVQQQQQRIGLCHFYIFRPLATHFKWRVALALDGEEGVREAITSSKRYMPVTPFASKCSLGPRRLWRVKMGDVIDPLNYFSLESAKRDWWWYPPRRQQLILDEVIPLVKEIDSLKLEMEKCKRDESELKKQLEELKVELEKRNCRNVSELWRPEKFWVCLFLFLSVCSALTTVKSIRST